MLFLGPLLEELEPEELELPSLRTPFSLEDEVLPLPSRLILRSFESSLWEVPVDSFVMVTDPGAADGRASPALGALIGEIVTFPSILCDEDEDEDDEEDELLLDEDDDPPLALELDFRSSFNDHLIL